MRWKSPVRCSTSERARGAGVECKYVPPRHNSARGEARKPELVSRRKPMHRYHHIGLIIGVLCASAIAPVGANDASQEAADTAEAFVYGRESKNEALLREISDPDQYEAMAGKRADTDRKLNENVHVDDVEIMQIDGDRAVAKATYRQKNAKGRKSADVYLKRVDGKWQVTTPPEATD
jgi:hypothetical protein